jgi:hypothetical protein
MSTMIGRHDRIGYAYRQPSQTGVLVAARFVLPAPEANDVDAIEQMPRGRFERRVSTQHDVERRLAMPSACVGTTPTECVGDGFIAHAQAI